MSLVAKVAYLDVCPLCSGHGQFVYSDGTKSIHFGTTKKAFEVLQTAQKDEKVTPEEVLALREQVKGSSMDMEDPFIEELMDLINILSESATRQYFEAMHADQPVH